VRTRGAGWEGGPGSRRRFLRCGRVKSRYVRRALETGSGALLEWLQPDPRFIHDAVQLIERIVLTLCFAVAPTGRSDVMHPAGPLRVRDLVAILPMLDETVLLECSGQQVRCDCAGIVEDTRRSMRGPRVLVSSGGPGAACVASTYVGERHGVGAEGGHLGSRESLACGHGCGPQVRARRRHGARSRTRAPGHRDVRVRVC
jgi:hypothetical protein